jgi:hypothetical protein
MTCTSTTGCRAGTENVCFCDPNNQFACQGCEMVDAGAGGTGGGGAGGNGGANACPSANAGGMGCTTPMTFCTLACPTGNMTEVCRCRAPGGGNADAGNAWQCAVTCP